MKKILFTLIGLLSLQACGIGVYTISSGNDDISCLSFCAPKEYEINVNVDGKDYTVNTIKYSAYKNNRNIKKAVKNRICIEPGTHLVTVSDQSGQVYSKKIFVSASENKTIEL